MISLFPARRLFAHPFDESAQFRCFSYLIDTWIHRRQRFVCERRVDHAVALGANQLHMFLSAAFLSWQAVVLRQALFFEGASAQGTGDCRVHAV